MKYLINKGLFMSLFASTLMAFSASASLLDQVDNFDTGLENWAGQNKVLSEPITYEITGGPEGVGDAYLQLSRDEIAFHIGTYNTNQWVGDYVAEGITALQVDLNHLAGPTPMKIRIMIWGDGGVFGSINTLPLPAPGGGWNTYSFGLTASDLVHVTGGTSNLVDTLSTVNRIMIRNDYDTPTLPGSHPPHILGTLGIDNVQAISEPMITSFEVSPGMLEMEISNVNTGGTYYVESTQDLTTNGWVEVGDSFEGLIGSTNWMDSLGATTSSFYRVVRDPYHAKVGEVATFTNYFHGIAGTAHIVNNRTIELRNFYYDGLGPAVVAYVSTNSAFYPGYAISDYLNGTAYANTNLAFTLPAGLVLNDITYISIWCIDFSANFGDGEFQ